MMRLVPLLLLGVACATGSNRSLATQTSRPCTSSGATQRAARPEGRAGAVMGAEHLTQGGNDWSSVREPETPDAAVRSAAQPCAE